MNSQEDKFIVEQLGGCWHKFDWEPSRFQPFCNKCGQGDCYPNPDFTSDPVSLLKLIKKTPERFLLFIRHMYGFTDQAVFGLADDLSDNDGKFRDKFFKWLGGEEHDPFPGYADDGTDLRDSGDK